MSRKSKFLAVVAFCALGLSPFPGSPASATIVNTKFYCDNLARGRTELRSCMNAGGYWAPAWWASLYQAG